MTTLELKDAVYYDNVAFVDVVDGRGGGGRSPHAVDCCV